MQFRRHTWAGVQLLEKFELKFFSILHQKKQAEQSAKRTTKRITVKRRAEEDNGGKDDHERLHEAEISLTPSLLTYYVMALPEVQVELFEKGKGPRHTFKTKLQGWEANRLDLETIQNTYHLKAVYAYSTTTGRGQRLPYHPRNGLSLVCYSGKPGVTIRLDSDPKLPVGKYLLKVGAGVLLATCLLFFFHRGAWPSWLHNLVDRAGGGIGWIIAFVIFLGTQAAAGWPLRRKTRPTTR